MGINSSRSTGGPTALPPSPADNIQRTKTREMISLSYYESNFNQLPSSPKTNTITRPISSLKRRESEEKGVRNSLVAAAAAANNVELASESKPSKLFGIVKQVSKIKKAL